MVFLTQLIAPPLLISGYSCMTVFVYSVGYVMEISQAPVIPPISALRNGDTFFSPGYDAE
jgi:hypothetical protein